MQNCLFFHKIDNCRKYLIENWKWFVFILSIFFITNLIYGLKGPFFYIILFTQYNTFCIVNNWIVLMLQNSKCNQNVLVFFYLFFIFLLTHHHLRKLFFHPFNIILYLLFFFFISIYFIYEQTDFSGSEKFIYLWYYLLSWLSLNFIYFPTWKNVTP